MVNRPAGGARSERYERVAYDWYCEGPDPVHQLLDLKDPDGLPMFRDHLVYDPSCGRGNILDVAKARGHETIGSDIIERTCPISGTRVSTRHRFFRGNFLLLRNVRIPTERGIAVVNNPPYSYEEDICERFIRKAITSVPASRYAFLVPIAFIGSGDRYAFFTRDHRPSHVAVLCDRPSCPPGPTVDRYTKFKGGMQDYVWIIYTPPHRWRTEQIWIPPS